MANVARPRLRRVPGGTAEEEEEEKSKGSRRSQTTDGGVLGCFQPPILTAPCFILNLLQQPRSQAATELSPASCRQTGSTPYANVPQLAGQTRGKLPRAPALARLVDLPNFSREGSLSPSPFRPPLWRFSFSQERKGATRQVFALFLLLPPANNSRFVSFPLSARLPCSHPSLGEKRPTKRPPPGLGPGERTPSVAA